MEHSAPPAGNADGDSDTDSDETPGPAPSDGKIFPKAPPRKYHGKSPAFQVSLFDHGKIKYFATDHRFEATCFAHDRCVLTRAARLQPVAHMHWWLTHGCKPGVPSTKADHWTPEFVNPDSDTIDIWRQTQDFFKDPMYMELRRIEESYL